ncbi:MAG: dienelactone hydrolase family protein [Planctomycetes bacterium]|nr:dienelactone hydrolase family protein [Planctomycetota bacterium]
MTAIHSILDETIRIDTGIGSIFGTLAIPERAWGAVLFAHGSGSSRHSPRNQYVAESLQELGMATLLVDLLTPGEVRVDAFTARHRFDIGLLTDRLIAATNWLDKNYAQHNFRLGYFGASTGAAAALRAAAARPEVAAVVSRGGRPDLAGPALPRVTAATLLIVGELDQPVSELNRAAYEQLDHVCRKEVAIVPNATHLFEEPGALEEVTRLAGQWFVRYLGAAASRVQPVKSVRGARSTQSAL